MIWQSVTLMTVIDMLIVSATAYVVYLISKHSRALAEIGGLTGVWVAMSRLGAVPGA